MPRRFVMKMKWSSIHNCWTILEILSITAHQQQMKYWWVKFYRLKRLSSFHSQNPAKFPTNTIITLQDKFSSHVSTRDAAIFRKLLKSIAIFCDGIWKPRWTNLIRNLPEIQYAIAFNNFSAPKYFWFSHRIWHLENHVESAWSMCKNFGSLLESDK